MQRKQKHQKLIFTSESIKVVDSSTLTNNIINYLSFIKKEKNKPHFGGNNNYYSQLVIREQFFFV